MFRKRSEIRLTRVCSQVAGEGVAAAARVATERALEGLLARVELDVPQQVALLGERHATLAALEGPVPCREEPRDKGPRAGQHQASPWEDK